MKLLISSMFFDSGKAEEPVSAFIIENGHDSGFKTYFSSLPEMKPSYLATLQEGVSATMEMEVLPSGEDVYVH